MGERVARREYDHTRSLPADGHVHSEWSWDALAGSMEQSCAQATEVGLPSVAFTEHADFMPWTLQEDADLSPAWRALVSNNVLNPPEIDLDGYFACLERCRDKFPDLRILSGVELSEPHWYQDRSAALLRRGEFDRVLSSIHSAAMGDEYHETADLYRTRPPGDVVRGYLAEVRSLIREFDDFEVLAHIDYPVRYWPAHVLRFDPRDFEDDYRQALRELADSGRVLEVNTRVPLHELVVRWWHEEGGRAVAFASDAHEPSLVANDFAAAAAMVEACGFRPGRTPQDFWSRCPS